MYPNTSNLTRSTTLATEGISPVIPMLHLPELNPASPEKAWHLEIFLRLVLILQEVGAERDVTLEFFSGFACHLTLNFFHDGFIMFYPRLWCQAACRLHKHVRSVCKATNSGAKTISISVCKKSACSYWLTGPFSFRFFWLNCKKLTDYGFFRR